MHSVIFFGTDEFSVSILDAMLEEKVNILAVVTKPDTAKRHNKKFLPSPVKKFILDRGLSLPLLQPCKASTPEFAETLRGFKPDLFVVVSYGEIVSDELLAIPNLMPINIHPSLLPKYRGASPLRSALLNGDKKIGVAVIEMVKAMDAGEILKLEELDVEENENHDMLEKRVFKKARKVLLDVLEDFKQGTIQKTPQKGDITFTKKFSTADREICWSEDADTILNKINAFGESPAAFCYVQVGDKKLRLKILKAEIISRGKTLSVKTVNFSLQSGWEIACMNGNLSILRVHQENKKPTDIQDFINGARGACPQVIFQ